MNIEELAIKCINELKDEGVVKKKLKDTLQETIESNINDMFRSYSDFNSALKDKMKEEVKLELGMISFAEYSKFTTDVIKQVIDSSINDNVKSIIEKDVKKYLEPLEKTEWKLSEIIEKFKEESIDFEHGSSDEEFWGEEISLIEDIDSYRSGNSFNYVYFDIDKSVDSKYNCSYKIATHNGELFNVTINSSAGDKLSHIPIHGFDAFMYKLYVAKATIIWDIKDVDLYIDDPGD